MSIRLCWFSLMAVVLSTVACASGPPYQGMAPEEMFALGQERFDRGDWGDAVDVLDRLMAGSAGATFERGAEARFLLARANFEDGKYLISLDEFSRFLSRFSSHELAPRANLGICQSFHMLSPIPERDQIYTDQAVRACENVARDYAGVDDEVSQEAATLAIDARDKLAEKEYLNADFYYRRGYLDSANIYAQRLAEDFADTDWAPRAILLLICSYQKIGYDDEVADWRDRLLGSYPDSPEALGLERENGASC